MCRATGIDLVAQAIGQTPQRRDIHAVMGQFDISQGGLRRLTPIQCITDAGDQQTVFDGVESLGTLGMARTHLMLAARRLCEVSGLVHSRTSRRENSCNVMPCIHNKKSNIYCASLTR